VGVVCKCACMCGVCDVEVMVSRSKGAIIMSQVGGVSNQHVSNMMHH